MSGFLSGWNLLPEVPGALNTAMSRAVRKAAFTVQRRAMLNAPVDTGFLKNSIYTVTHDGGGNYDAQAEAADSRRSVVGKHSGRMSAENAVMFESVDTPPNDRTAYVAVGANYGLYVEFGTARTAAQPYLLPAVEATRGEYLAALSSLEGVLMSLLGGGGSITMSATPETDEEPF